MTIHGLWRKKHTIDLLLFEGVSGVFAHGQLHILNVIFRLTAVCETATSNKKDKLNVETLKCVFCVRVWSSMFTVDGDDKEEASLQFNLQSTKASPFPRLQLLN